MTNPKAKGETLSVGAKSHVEDLAKQYVYGYRKSIRTKELEKGTVVEKDSIALLNEVLFTNYSKNTERRENEWLTGEADIIDWPGRKIKDVKSSWSLETFPATPDDGRSSLYDWQQKGYCMLYDCNEAELCYCLVDTPEELIGYEDERLHIVSHIEPRLRVTRVPVQRDAESEKLIREKCDAAQQYFLQAVEAIHQAHKF